MGGERGGEGLPSIPSVIGKGEDRGEGEEAAAKDHPGGGCCQGGCDQLSGYRSRPKRGDWSLGVPVVVMMLSGNDYHHRKDGAQDHGGDAHRQANEGEVAGLPGGNFCRYDVATGNSSSHLMERTKSVGTGGEHRCCSCKTRPAHGTIYASPFTVS